MGHNYPRFMDHDGDGKRWNKVPPLPFGWSVVATKRITTNVRTHVQYYEDCKP